MIGLAGTLLAAASLSFSAQPEARPLSLLDVPFISQSEALCGGAAASMVLRYWGETSVRAEDFAALVDRTAGGIRTGDLVAAIAAREPAAVAAEGNAPLAQAELAAGRPVIALIEDRPGALHYVVLVGWHERAVVFHDPARTPFVVMQPDAFERRWKVARNWMLSITRGSGRPRLPAQRSEGSGLRTSDSNSEATHVHTPCDGLVAAGVAHAQNRDLPSAERLLADAAYQCPGAAPLRELAGVRLLQRRWPEVRDLAARAVAIDATDAHAWRLLATSRYIEGDRSGALDAWNRAGDPVLDLVSVSGLDRTPHRTVERLLGLDVERLLTSRHVERSRRRLDELPGAFTTRLEYVTRGSGRAEVRAHVAEAAVLPTGRLAWAMIAARSAATRELSIGINSLSRRGERLEARWRFWPHRPAYGVALSAPAGSLGILTLEGFREQQPFTLPEVPAADRAGGRIQLANWASGALRWDVRGGLDRWAEEGTFGNLGAAARLEHKGATVKVGGTLWLGNTPFGVGEMAGRWSSSREPRGMVVSVDGGFQAVGANAPLDLWAAGDTGHTRAPLLRAHPVLRDGRLDLQRLGRRMAHGSLEVQRWRAAPGPLRVGLAGFLDAARTSLRFGGASEIDADAGIGLRFAVPGHRGWFRLDIAHGLRDGRNAVSLAFDRRP